MHVTFKIRALEVANTGYTFEFDTQEYLFLFNCSPTFWETWTDWYEGHKTNYFYVVFHFNLFFSCKVQASSKISPNYLNNLTMDAFLNSLCCSFAQWYVPWTCVPFIVCGMGRQINVSHLSKDTRSWRKVIGIRYKIIMWWNVTVKWLCKYAYTQLSVWEKFRKAWAVLRWVWSSSRSNLVIVYLRF